MGLIFGLIKTLLKIFIYFAIFAAFIVLIPNLPPYTSFTKIDVEPQLAYVGPLAPNEALNNPAKLYMDKLSGPEAFQLYKGEVYTSLATGEIVKLSPGGHITFVTKIGQPCTGVKEEHICGRPLGFVIDENKNQMYIADAYHGIWKVDLATDKKQMLVSPHVAIKGQLPKLFNCVALDGNGNLYWTHSTSDFDLKDGAYALTTDPTGRLLQYNAVKNESTVLLDNIWFANGIVVSPDNQFVVVAESFSSKLYKYYVNGPKKGKSEKFAGLPGSPDNLRVLPDGSGILVALYAVHSESDPLLSRSLAAAPLARKFVARLQRLVELAVESLHSVYPHVIFEDIIYNIGHFKSFNALMPKSAGILQMDWDGNIVASYFHTQGLLHVSDAIVYNDKLYLGQPHSQNFIAAVPAPPLLKKAFTSNVQKAQEKIEKPKTETPKVATPPKPVETVKTAAPKKEQKIETPKPTPPTPKPTPPPVKVEKSKPEPPKVQEKEKNPKPATPEPRSTPQATTKPVETVKTTTPKPIENKVNAGSPSAAKPTQEANAKPKAAQQPETKPASPPRAAQEKATTEKPTAKPVQKQKPAKPDSPKVNVEPIPIKEEIPSDTVKPNKETLKVIKKDGPTEIPNPHV